MKQYLLDKFTEVFGTKPTTFIDCGGRIEIIGNHTDHNHGKCMAATCDLKISSALVKNEDLKVKVISEGNEPVEFCLCKLDVDEKEYFTSKAIIKGIAKWYLDHGYSIGGFNAYMTSTIFSGAGVSSSAAYELLVCKIFSEFFNDNKVSDMEMAFAGQYAENVYFGKKCGLLDQIGVGFGNMSVIDFKDIAHPSVQSIKFPFDNIHFVIVNTGGSHAALSHLYTAIPTDMKNAARKMGHEFLRECSLEEFASHREEMSEMEIKRTQHFFNENKNVEMAMKALKEGNEQMFLDAITASRISSTNDLKNMMVEDQYEGSPLEACDLALKVLGNEGSIRINGGGFAGSVIASVPTNKLDKFILEMSKKYGAENVKEVHIREVGPSLF